MYEIIFPQIEGKQKAHIAIEWGWMVLSSLRLHKSWGR
jgi:hypothetical protein